MRLRQEDLDWREADGEILVLDRRRGRYFAVTASGGVLWPALATGTTEEELVTLLSERYSLDRSRAREDVLSFLSWLSENDLLGS